MDAGRHVGSNAGRCAMILMIFGGRSCLWWSAAVSLWQSLRGVSLCGVSLCSVALHGVAPRGVALRGVAIHSVALCGVSL